MKLFDMIASIILLRFLVVVCSNSYFTEAAMEAAHNQLNKQPSQTSGLLSNYELLPQLSMVVAVHLVHIPGTDRYLFMERPSGYHPDNTHHIAGSFDLVERTWVHLDSPDGLFCCGHSVLSNGSVVIMGGHVANAGYADGRWSIRTYTDGTPALIKATKMQYPRWYPSVTLLPDEKVLVMGGTQGVGAGTAANPYYEIWDPQVPEVTQSLLVNPAYLKSIKQNYYPFNYILPSGDLFTYCARTGYIMNAYTAEYILPVPRRPMSNVAPADVYVAQYPYTATSVLLPLRPEDNYTPEVVIFGGQNVKASNNLHLPACSESIRIRISMPTEENPMYSFNGGWVQEAMSSPRVMPDAVLLPNGVVIVMNGAHEGLAGDAASGGGSKAFYPNFHAEMYDPYAPVGQRYTTLARSTIPRLYHSTTALTTNGTVLVAGCDRCGKVVTNLTFAPSPAKAEYRSEIFYPPFWYDMDKKPQILDAPSEVEYGEEFTVSFSALTGANPNVTVTSAVFLAPSSTTHSFNTNQRVVNLVMLSGPENGEIVLQAPPSPNHAPPQLYMLFLLNERTYSSAVWIKLKRSVLEDEDSLEADVEER